LVIAGAAAWPREGIALQPDEIYLGRLCNRITRGQRNKHRLFGEAPDLKTIATWLVENNDGVQLAVSNARDEAGGGIRLLKREIHVRICTSKSADRRGNDRVEGCGAALREVISARSVSDLPAGPPEWPAPHAWE
jgi:hypothetical protein